MKIVLVLYTGTDTRLCDRLAASVGGFYECESGRAPAVRPEPVDARDDRRDQSRSDVFLDDLESWRREQPEPAGEEMTLVVGITVADLFVPRMNFIFGEADRERRTAIVSGFRLRPGSSDEDSVNALLFERLVKEVIHETGHLLGLDHCFRPGCIMQFSRTVDETDTKGPGFCDRCAARIDAASGR